ncbi:hypothetical protein VTK73DRAFT_7761 [Phialemonium thermophilum]|uniref:Nudix hydrolase domain-containing protein n=1 Tax=Phialemonium thermophilum TaxID=223376 RepID=A0ABR3XRJ8_9PEZI
MATEEPCTSQMMSRSPSPPHQPPLEFTSDESLSRFAVPLQRYLRIHPELDAVAVGALVFAYIAPGAISVAAQHCYSKDNGYGNGDRTSGGDEGPSASEPACDHILLIQRAAHDSFPLRWEIPGGSCDPDDPTILHGVGRELWEETGLLMTAIRSAIGSGDVFFASSFLWGLRRVTKYTFEVEVVSAASASEESQSSAVPESNTTVPQVTLDPNEHQAYIWATEEECRTKKKGQMELQFTTRDQEAAILAGFQWQKARRTLRMGAQ